MEGRTPCYTIGGDTYKIGQSSPVCNFSANGFRLPSGIEREYAARGGLKGKRFPWGDTISHDLANYNAGGRDYDESNGLHPDYVGSGSGNHTSPVGSFSANNYGLFDMVGNINEWCWDDSGSNRNVRGCSCSSGAWYGRCGAGDDYFFPTTTFNGFGFRTVCQ
jgi:formylglycine-generating enzyme required for sulfatase activity